MEATFQAESPKAPELSEWPRITLNVATCFVGPRLFDLNMGKTADFRDRSAPRVLFPSGHHPVCRQHFGLFQHCVRSFFLQVGRIAILAKDTFDQYPQMGADVFTHCPVGFIVFFWTVATNSRAMVKRILRRLWLSSRLAEKSYGHSVGTGRSAVGKLGDGLTGIARVAQDLSPKVRGFTHIEIKKPRTYKTGRYI